MFKHLNEKTYIVGGAIRNEILGLEAKDIDFVVADTTTEEYEAAFPHHSKVGNTFPVYLNDNGDEVALARIERSTGNSYQDFEVVAGVDIVSDLSRRDFSINSIAKHIVSGEVIDPFNGREDIHNKIIRTINDNFVKDDPLRVYRLARFAAEFDFNIDKKTADIVRRDASYIKNVLPERIYAELKKNYERSPQPSIFFRVLFQLDVLKYHFKPLYVAAKIPAGPFQYHGVNSVFDHLLNSLDYAKQKGYSFSVAVSALLHDFGKILTEKALLPKHHGHEFRGLKLIEKFFEQHRFDAHTVQLAKLASKKHMVFHNLLDIKKPVKLIRFFKEIKNNVDEVVQVADCDHPLTQEQLEVIEKLKRTFKETVIQIPAEIKGKEAITNFVESKYTQKYKELSRI